uniref:Mitochondrial import receptor subunit TOM22 homolog n=1 Tax=Glossina pallidipes TaxID=7398 RepID=A0A1B0A234_GLOPL
MATIAVGKEKAPEANTIIATASESATTIATPISNCNKEEDRESYDDEPAETIKERLWGLTEMFPEPLREFTSGLICLTSRGIMRVYRSACSATWICFTTSMILFAPVIFETERAQVEEMQKMKHKQVLLGSGVGGLPVIDESAEPVPSTSRSKAYTTDRPGRLPGDMWKHTLESLLGIDGIPMVSVYEWTIEDICRWLRNLGYRQYQNTFRDNLINGRTLLLLDASALSAINIKDFNHLRDIAGKIRGLFIYEMTKFGHRISLPPEYLLELYKLFRVRNGVKYDRVRAVDFWRHLQIVREKTPYHSHWELLERWLSKEKFAKFSERFENAPRRNLYECNIKTASPIKMATCVQDRPYDSNTKIHG